MNGIDLTHAETETPTPGTEWLKTSPEMRLRWVDGMARDHAMKALDARVDGSIVVAFDYPEPADNRGTALLDFEARLKRTIDPALTIYLQPVQDKNAVRRFRGVTVKEERSD